ncbi:MAG TPA: cyclase family protein [bacterium]|nr:cyclase family protein [bacterium]
MHRAIAVRAVLVALLIPASAFAVTQGRLWKQTLIDLTHALEITMPQYSDAQPFHLQKLSDYDDGYLSYGFSAAEHMGTHVDAPRHFWPNGRTVDRITLSELAGRAVVINVVEESKRNPDYELTTDDLKAWELRYGPIARNSIVILRTGWESKWYRPKDFMNRDKLGVMHSPGFSCDVVDYLAHNRAVRALGTDTLSIDPGRSEAYCAHKVLLKTDKYAIEGLTNLEKLPPQGATIVVTPLKIAGGSGAPARVFALVP